MKTTLLAVAMCFAASSAFAGVNGISENGSSASGKTAYKITCSNGQEYRIWRSGGEWWDARGAQGGNSRDLNEQASFLCG